MNLIVDVGNTNVKLAVFEEDKLIEVVTCDKKNILTKIKNILKKYSITRGIMSNVGFVSEKVLLELQKLISIQIVKSTTRAPFINLYKTPNTLGVDRIALITSAVNQYKNKNVLVIDAGSCVTFDLVNANGEYLGGAISPGVKMRFNSLHHFTAKLPLLEKEEINDFIGKSTSECITIGVINGVIQEIEGVINQYKNKYENLSVVLTGGEAKFLSKQLKSSIFVSQYFLLQGLNELLVYNLDN